MDGWGSRAFPGAEAIVDRHDSLAAALKAFYNRQDSQRQADFRQATANLLATLERVPENLPLFQRILQLAVRLPAPEIFPVLAFRIRQGFLLRWPDKDAETLFTESMLAVSQLAAPRSDALPCLNELIQSPSFADPYPHAATALIALNRIQPDQFVAHMNRLRPMLNRQFSHYRVKQEQQRQLAVALLAAVGPLQLLEGLITLKDQTDRKTALAQDHWLMQALFSRMNDDIPVLECREEPYEKILEFFLRKSPDNPIHPKMVHSLGWSRFKGILEEQNWFTKQAMPSQTSASISSFINKPRPAKPMQIPHQL
ncbi:MAG: hypothetical protein H7833_11505 [Magnetococcus sp. DMHC-1]